MQDSQALHTNFLQSSPGNDSSKRLVMVWLCALVTGTFIKAWLGYPIQPGLVTLTEFALGSIATIGVGGTAAEQLSKIKNWIGKKGAKSNDAR